MMPKDRDGRALTARYEDLRRWAVAPAGALPHPYGLALLVQQGLPAWMRAWLARVPPVPAADAEPLRRVSAGPSPLPSAGSALVVLLSTMALASRTEDRPC
jgi:hypothetical protein